MSERSELRSRREERVENGVKNLKGTRLFPKTFSNNGDGDAYVERILVVTKKRQMYNRQENIQRRKTWVAGLKGKPWQKK